MNDTDYAELFSLKGVYPNVQQLLALRKYTQRLSLDAAVHTNPSAGNWHSRARGRGLDFAEVRLYQAGDDIRSIDWRVTAKTQKTHTRLFTQERERPIILAADLRSDMFFGSVNCFKSVSCAALMSALSWIALDAKDRVGGIVIGDDKHMELRPKSSRKVVLSFIHYLHEYAQQLKSPIALTQKQSLNQLLTKLKRVTKPGSAIYIASDFHDIATVNPGLLSKICQHNQVTFILISDPLEWKLPADSHLRISDGVGSNEIGSNVNFNIMQQRLEKLEAICMAHRIEILQLSTADNLISVLQQRFSGRRQVGYQ
ncbi:MAG: DUF58 domain-containing protein [Oceanospirillaceae bacterium]|nr:DUF58 domain-containing protein [Oceanospirillaceae bacterium]